MLGIRDNLIFQWFFYFAWSWKMLICLTPCVHLNASHGHLFPASFSYRSLARVNFCDRHSLFVLSPGKERTRKSAQEGPAANAVDKKRRESEREQRFHQRAGSGALIIPVCGEELKVAGPSVGRSAGGTHERDKLFKNPPDKKREIFHLAAQKRTPLGPLSPHQKQGDEN